MGDYCVYVHTTPSKKRYVGITKQNPKKRWGNGNGYKGQVFYKAVEKYGWDNIKHEILYSNLDEEEAKKIEKKLISDYKTLQRNYGYNASIGGDTGQTDSYMCRDAVELYWFLRRCGYDEALEVAKYWKFLCEDKLEAQVFNNAFRYVMSVAEKNNIMIQGNWCYYITGAIQVYLEAWKNNWHPECAMYNSEYYLLNVEGLIYDYTFNKNDEWKKKIPLEVE